MKTILGVIATAGVFAVLAAPVLVGWEHTESYCPLWPSFDTTFASGYAEEKFASIEVGMTGTQVQAILGAPLEKVIRRDGTESWWYSQDGACWVGDWAWLGREITLRNGRVSGKEASVCHD